MNSSFSYKDAGVDIEKGDMLVEKIKLKVKDTYNNRVAEGVGGFACLYEITPEKLIAAGTDGVGTKLKIAQHLNIHNTIGIDLVAMCVNDIICTGATPLFFMDYLASGNIDLETSSAIIDGIVEGCKESNMALIGGETAEMPGMYQNDEYDLAGFAVGEILKKDLINGSHISEGDTLIAIASSGIHSNGFSLVRKLISMDETAILKDALTPTRIYTKIVAKFVENKNITIKGIAHITGGGIENIPRINKNFDYHLEKLPPMEEIPSIFTVLKERSKLDRYELYKTFNMGMGLVIATSTPDELMKTLSTMNEKFWKIGSIKKGTGQVTLP